MTQAQVARAFVMSLALLAVYAFVRTAGDAEARHACTALCALRPNYAARDRLVPNFELEAYAGGKVSLSQFRGKNLVLNFWTTSCAPCLEEMPSLAALGKSLKSVGNTELITISTDESKATIADTLKSVFGGEAPFIVLWDPESSVVGDKFGTKLFPETWFIDTHGVIRARMDGARDWSKIVVLDLVRSFANPIDCDVKFVRGRVEGPEAALCESIPPA
jgi:peroxiredoxin